MNRFLTSILHSLKWMIYPTPHVSQGTINQRFEGREVVITGASKGIGRCLTLMLIESHANLTLIARSEAELSKLCDIAHSKGCKAQYYSCDLRDRKALDTLCTTLRTSLPHVDYIFCNAGKSICRTISDAQNRLHDYDRTMDLNYRSMVALTLALLPSLSSKLKTLSSTPSPLSSKPSSLSSKLKTLSSKLKTLSSKPSPLSSKLKTLSSKLIYTSSVSTLYPMVSGWSAYHASKTAANAWCKTAAKELKHKGIQVQIAYMPLVRTAMSDANPDYKNLPAYTAHEAAKLLLRLAMSKRHSYMPWWARISYKLVCLFT